jgi:hypothetical protein
MENITIDNKTLDKYVRFLTRLDNNTKRKLIIKLTESLEFEEKEPDLKSLFGAWEDSRDAAEIIKDIRESRVNKHDVGSLD